ncbi:hypothetical protein Lalb_Chr04g0254111 [Lupinus albus]|uniref:Transmembrane protein n=1 Tax=Lupinus albus TaxID=3870 RepID=A0A6A4QPF7_LUPAL|nr:hypothetical protein Lalb_Chr04g0254111 [Lupinus albus]
MTKAKLVHHMINEAPRNQSKAFSKSILKMPRCLIVIISVVIMVVMMMVVSVMVGVVVVNSLVMMGRLGFGNGIDGRDSGMTVNIVVIIQVWKQP